MITYIELWKAKQAWLDLSTEERGKYMTALGPAIQQLTETGAQIIGWGKNESTTFNSVDFDYFAIWTFPNTEAAQNFEKLVEGAGWYKYFDQANVMGQAGSPQEVIGKLVAL